MFIKKKEILFLIDMKKKEGYFVFLYCIDKKFLFLNGSVLKDYYVFRGLKIDCDLFFI